LADRDRVEMDGIEVLLGQLRTGLVEPLALAAIFGVRDRRAEHPEADLLAVAVRLELGLEGRELLAVLFCQVAEVPIAGEAPELADAAVPVDSLLESLCPLQLRQVLVALVDRLELELVLQAGEVEVVLLVELGDEMIGVFAVAVEILRSGRGARHRP